MDMPYRSICNNGTYIGKVVASAGLNQGQILGVTKLAQNFSNGQRDLLYKNAINVSVSFPG